MSHRGASSSGDDPAASEPAREHDAELRAIEDHFVEAHRMGDHPRLAAYLRRYPQYAEELAAFASAFLPETALEMSESEGETHARRAPSPGTQRALDAIFAGTGYVRQQDETLLVAEERAPYATREAGLSNLAHSHGLSVDALADLVDLTPEVLAELTNLPLMPEDLPPPLARRLAEALAVGVDDVERVLAYGRDEPTQQERHLSRLSLVRALLTDHPSLSAEQRQRWRAVLSRDA